MPKFTPETARAAAAARRAKKLHAAELPAIDSTRRIPEADEPRVPASFHGGLPPVEHAKVVVTPPSAAPPTVDAPEDAPTLGGDIGTPAQTRVEVLQTPFTPEIVEQFVGIAFDLVGAATGRPNIWKLDPEEIKPISGAMGRQLGRIPIIRAIGPDNTELMIVAAGLGVIVTKRLNEHADEVQQERQAKAQQLRAEPARAGDIASRSSAPAAAAAPASNFATEGGGIHIGQVVH